MKLDKWAHQILFGTEIEDKLLNTSELDLSSISDYKVDHKFTIPDTPGRSNKLSFVEKPSKFPKVGSLIHDEKKAITLHFFANHELLAIEMMAAALLLFPNETNEEIAFKKGLVQTLKDEQKHFKLYCSRMSDWGMEFGDEPLNSFFWKKMSVLKTPAEYLATMALTFESANLDFASFYRDTFSQIEDQKTSTILNTVYEDEISHVAFGRNFLDLWRNDKDLWTYYQELLPFPITPARSKGRVFDMKSRVRAGLPEDFIQKQRDYRDEFSITDRKEWKK